MTPVPGQVVYAYAMDEESLVALEKGVVVWIGTQTRGFCTHGRFSTDVLLLECIFLENYVNSYVEPQLFSQGDRKASHPNEATFKIFQAPEVDTCVKQCLVRRPSRLRRARHG